MQELYVFRSALPYVSPFALHQLGEPTVLNFGHLDVPHVMRVQNYEQNLLNDIIRYDMEIVRVCR